MYQFLHRVNKVHGQQLSSYHELHQWSIENINEFWQDVWEFVGVRAQGEATRVSQRLIEARALRS
jgi:acetoacetyl-CoA synthetase